MPFNNFPYTNMNDLNLDFLLKNQKQIEQYIKDNIGQIAVEALFDNATGRLVLNAGTEEPEQGENLTGIQLGNQYHDINIQDLENIVFFGDSWTNGTGASNTANRFSSVLARRLNKTEFNFGVGGAGFALPGHLISSQISTAETTMSENQRERVKYVIINGGLNDWTQRNSANITKTAWTAAVEAAVRAAHNIFPNAFIVACIANTQQYYFPDEWSEWILSAQQLLKQLSAFLPLIVVQNCAECINFNPAFYSSDQIHPNDAGHKAFANHIYSGIIGGGTEVKYYFGDLVLADGVTTDIPPKLFRDGDNMIIVGNKFTFPASPSGSLVRLGFLKNGNPNEIAGATNMYFPCYFGNLVIGTISITSGGSVYLMHSRSTNLDICYVNDMTYRLNRA